MISPPPSSLLHPPPPPLRPTPGVIHAWSRSAEFYVIPRVTFDPAACPDQCIAVLYMD